MVFEQRFFPRRGHLSGKSSPIYWYAERMRRYRHIEKGKMHYVTGWSDKH